MPQPWNRRLTGLALALGLNAAFYAMFAWHTRPRVDDIPEPSRTGLVWIEPRQQPAAPPPAPVIALAAPSPRTFTPRRKTVRPGAISAQPSPLPQPISDIDTPLDTDAPDPFAQQESVTARSLDKGVVRAAIKTAFDEQKAVEDKQQFVRYGHAKNKYEKFADGADFATMPYCLGQNSMKFNPPAVKVGGVTIGLGGILALPFYAKTVATGKCRMK